MHGGCGCGRVGCLWVVCELFDDRECAFIVVECRHVVIQHGHVTLLVRVGGVTCEGDGCREEGEGDVGDIRGCGVRVCACGHVCVIVVMSVPIGPLHAVVVVFERVSPLIGHLLELFELARLVSSPCSWVASIASHS